MRHMNHMQGLLRRRVGLICVPVDELVHFVHSFNQWVLIRWGVVEFVYDGEREREREKQKESHASYAIQLSYSDYTYSFTRRRSSNRDYGESR
jgi:hypothetical protein